MDVSSYGPSAARNPFVQPRLRFAEVARSPRKVYDTTNGPLNPCQDDPLPGLDLALIRDAHAMLRRAPKHRLELNTPSFSGEMAANDNDLVVKASLDVAGVIHTGVIARIDQNGLPTRLQITGRTGPLQKSYTIHRNRWHPDPEKDFKQIGRVQGAIGMVDRFLRTVTTQSHQYH